jgi:hypothetical protein
VLLGIDDNLALEETAYRGTISFDSVDDESGLA